MIYTKLFLLDLLKFVRTKVLDKFKSKRKRTKRKRTKQVTSSKSITDVSDVTNNSSLNYQINASYNLLLL